VERQLAAAPGTYCHGDTPTLADCVLVPQIFNAKRFNCRLDHVPHVMRVHAACMKLDAFERTRPEHCPDFV
jgi:glutathione S-transferase